jgi:ectoine hydroxylase-related dioxygenase (phytanoyl-CoA dioxygenase family)
MNASSEIAQNGYALIKNWLSKEHLTTLEACFPALGPRHAGARGGDLPSLLTEWISAHEGLRGLAGDLLARPAEVARVLVFDKSPESNWFVPWHQDRAENGTDRPVARLEMMIALRLHLDDCGQDNGPLEVLPGSHRHGRLESEAIAAFAAKTASQVCVAARGDVLAIQPLLVHRSQRARTPAARRVVHIEYSASDCL